jgi:YcaO-like protein with predicted kinase domain
MELNFENKYKDRTPEETIDILESFFQERGYQLIKVPTNSDIGTYSYYIQLRYNDIIVLISNGKGVSEKFALASALGELYERFCQYGYQAYNKTFMSRIVPNLDTKPLSLDDVKQNKNIMAHFNELLQNDSVIVDKVLNLITNNDPRGWAYANIANDNDIKYLDYRLLFHMNGSHGMAGGNTFEEAFNQGFSEICERYTLFKMFYQAGEYDFYQIDNNSITNPLLQQYIKNIEAQQKKVYIYDLSYTFETPVVMLVILDLKNHWLKINLGSFPVFDIALERTFTEIYQNIFTLKKQHEQIHSPYFNYKPEYLLYRNGSGFANESCLPEFILANSIVVNTPSKIWTHSGSNIHIFDYYKKLAQNFNWNVYVNNRSLIDNFYSLHIYVDERLYPIYYTSILKEYGPCDKRLLTQGIELIDKMQKSITSSDKSEQESFYKMYRVFESYPIVVKTILNLIMGRSWMDPMSQIEFDSFLFNDLQVLQIEDLHQYNQTIYFSELQKAILIFRYLPFKNDDFVG